MDGQWMAGKPAEARGSWGQAERCFWRSWPSLCPPGSQDVQGSAGPGFSADFSLLGMVFGFSRSAGCLVSSVRCWEGYIHLLFAGACGSLTCCAVGRLPEGISAPAASPAVQFP